MKELIDKLWAGIASTAYTKASTAYTKVQSISYGEFELTKDFAGGLIYAQGNPQGVKVIIGSKADDFPIGSWVDLSVPMQNGGISNPSHVGNLVLLVVGLKGHRVSSPVGTVCGLYPGDSVRITRINQTTWVADNFREPKRIWDKDVCSVTNLYTSEPDYQRSITSLDGSGSYTASFDGKLLRLSKRDLSNPDSPYTSTYAIGAATGYSDYQDLIDVFDKLGPGPIDYWPCTQGGCILGRIDAKFTDSWGLWHFSVDVATLTEDFVEFTVTPLYFGSLSPENWALKEFLFSDTPSAPTATLKLSCINTHQQEVKAGYTDVENFNSNRVYNVGEERTVVLEFGGGGSYDVSSQNNFFRNLTNRFILPNEYILAVINPDGTMGSDGGGWSVVVDRPLQGTITVEYFDQGTGLSRVRETYFDGGKYDRQITTTIEGMDQEYNPDTDEWVDIEGTGYEVTNIGRRVKVISHKVDYTSSRMVLKVLVPTYDGSFSLLVVGYKWKLWSEKVPGVSSAIQLAGGYSQQDRVACIYSNGNYDTIDYDWDVETNGDDPTKWSIGTHNYYALEGVLDQLGSYGYQGTEYLTTRPVEWIFAEWAYWYTGASEGGNSHGLTHFLGLYDSVGGLHVIAVSLTNPSVKALYLNSTFPFRYSGLFATKPTWATDTGRLCFPGYAVKSQLADIPLMDPEVVKPGHQPYVTITGPDNAVSRFNKGGLFLLEEYTVLQVPNGQQLGWEAGDYFDVEVVGTSRKSTIPETHCAGWLAFEPREAPTLTPLQTAGLRPGVRHRVTYTGAQTWFLSNPELKVNNDVFTLRANTSGHWGTAADFTGIDSVRWDYSGNQCFGMAIKHSHGVPELFLGIRNASGISNSWLENFTGGLNPLLTPGATVEIADFVSAADAGLESQDYIPTWVRVTANKDLPDDFGYYYLPYGFSTYTDSDGKHKPTAFPVRIPGIDPWYFKLRKAAVARDIKHAIFTFDSSSQPVTLTLTDKTTLTIPAGYVFSLALTSTDGISWTPTPLSRVLLGLGNNLQCFDVFWGSGETSGTLVGSLNGKLGYATFDFTPAIPTVSAWTQCGNCSPEAKGVELQRYRLGPDSWHYSIWIYNNTLGRNVTFTIWKKGTGIGWGALPYSYWEPVVLRDLMSGLNNYVRLVAIDNSTHLPHLYTFDTSTTGKQTPTLTNPWVNFGSRYLDSDGTEKTVTLGGLLCGYASNGTYYLLARLYNTKNVRLFKAFENGDDGKVYEGLPFAITKAHWIDFTDSDQSGKSKDTLSIFTAAGTFVDTNTYFSKPTEVVSTTEGFNAAILEGSGTIQPGTLTLLHPNNPKIIADLQFTFTYPFTLPTVTGVQAFEFVVSDRYRLNADGTIADRVEIHVPFNNVIKFATSDGTVGIIKKPGRYTAFFDGQSSWWILGISAP